MSQRFPFCTAIFTLVATAHSGCAAQSDTTTGTTESALTASVDGGTTAVILCFTTYVDCERAETSDASTCKRALHDCMRPDDGRDGPHGDCDRDGGAGDAGDRPPRPPHDHDGEDLVPDGDGGMPPEGGPRACIEALDACAATTATADTCATDALDCFGKLPPPPHHPPPDHDR